MQICKMPGINKIRACVFNPNLVILYTPGIVWRLFYML